MTQPEARWPSLLFPTQYPAPCTLFGRQRFLADPVETGPYVDRAFAFAALLLIAM